MMKRTGHTSTLEAVFLGLIATGAVSIAVTALVGAIRAGGEIFGSPSLSRCRCGMRR
ncbi:hypothetical protein G7085_13730 [Tessaracoccus sp. HDW20]|uniref:hypothetical protein n=1 Tax=Tessaracoccus coleopterorum TaxID=2714950 RepID=UPI0018D3CE8B|nr:hypothetical protein [Tessaracoccus coleopterorum]NHB85323.1 hypothetical protein [Tessaracoccus coleopterorum]